MAPTEPVPAFVCSRTWESLTPTRRPGVRRCDACHHDVHLTHDAEGVWRLARQGHCVAYAGTRTLGMFLPPAEPLPVVAWLVARDGPAAGTTFQLAATAVIGSAAPADIVLADPAIVAAHCRIERGRDYFAVVALEAAVVVVNGVRRPRFDLVDGDELVLGSTHLAFKSIA